MRKIASIFVILLLVCSMITLREEVRVEANPGDVDNDDFTVVDTQFIFNITQNLSNVIYNAYDEGELWKGRAFGSKGERYAADYIYDTMVDLGLSNVQKVRIENVSGSDPVIERIRNGDGNLTTKLEVLSKGLIINNSGDTSAVECYISTLWNKRIQK